MKKHSLIIFILLLAMPAARIYSQVTLDSDRARQALRVYAGEMTQEEEEKYLKNLSPEVKVKLEEIKKLNKNKYYGLLRGQSVYSLSQYYSPVISMYETQRGEYTSRKFDIQSEANKKQMESEIDVELILLKYKSADETLRQKLRGDLYNALGKLFDVRESFKQEEIKSLEKRLQELKESLNTRKQNRESIVSRRIKELLNEKDEFRW
jgi:polyhydroxyalkanoate synthesis regulator phasin